MGEIADMVLDGVLCQVCGCYMEDEDGDGFPVTCDACKTEERYERKSDDDADLI